jgi:hypothetical protein
MYTKGKLHEKSDHFITQRYVYQCLEYSIGYNICAVSKYLNNQINTQVKLLDIHLQI